MAKLHPGASQARSRGGSSEKHEGLGEKMAASHFGLGIPRSKTCEKVGCGLLSTRGAYCEEHAELFYRGAGE